MNFGKILFYFSIVSILPSDGVFAQGDLVAVQDKELVVLQ